MATVNDATYSAVMVAFKDDIDSMMPETSRIFDFNGLKILVYIGPNPITINDAIYADVYMSDVTDSPALKALSSGAYQQAPQSMLDTLPQAVVDTVKEEAAAAGDLINQAGQAALSAIKVAAAAVGQPIQTGIEWAIAAVAVLAFIFYAPRR
jgi:hypothetical protein